MKKYGNNDGLCISICEFEKTGKVKQTDGVKKEQSKCTGCGHTCWLSIKEKKDEQ